MGDLRGYGFGDWFRLFLRAIPALVAAVVVVALPIVLVGAVVYYLMPFGPR
jgi:hypothetical protein